MEDEMRLFVRHLLRHGTNMNRIGRTAGLAGLTMGRLLDMYKTHLSSKSVYVRNSGSESEIRRIFEVSREGDIFRALVEGGEGTRTTVRLKLDDYRLPFLLKDQEYFLRGQLSCIHDLYGVLLQQQVIGDGFFDSVYLDGKQQKQREDVHNGGGESGVGSLKGTNYTDADATGHNQQNSKKRRRKVLYEEGSRRSVRGSDAAPEETRENHLNREADEPASKRTDEHENQPSRQEGTLVDTAAVAVQPQPCGEAAPRSAEDETTDGSRGDAGEQTADKKYIYINESSERESEPSKPSKPASQGSTQSPGQPEAQSPRQTAYPPGLFTHQTNADAAQPYDEQFNLLASMPPAVAPSAVDSPDEELIVLPAVSGYRQTAGMKRAKLSINLGKRATLEAEELSHGNSATKDLTKDSSENDKDIISQYLEKSRHL